MSIEKTFQFDKIRHLDLPAPLCVSAQESLHSVLLRMKQARVSCVLVCQGKQLVGVFTTRDLLNKVINKAVDEESAIANFMTGSPTTLEKESSIAEAIRVMDSKAIRNLPLINDEGEVTGMISADHIVHYLVEHFPREIYNLPPRLQQNMLTPEGA